MTQRVSQIGVNVEIRGAAQVAQAGANVEIVGWRYVAQLGVQVELTGSDCPPLAEFGAPVNASHATARQLSATARIPAGWTDARLTFSVPSAPIGGPWWCGWRIMNAANTPIEAGGAIRDVSVLPPASTTVATGGLFSEAERMAAHHIELWGWPSGAAPQTDSSFYTFTPRLSASFAGICLPPETPPPGGARGPQVIWIM